MKVEMHKSIRNAQLRSRSPFVKFLTLISDVSFKLLQKR